MGTQFHQLLLCMCIRRLRTLFVRAFPVAGMFLIAAAGSAQTTTSPLQACGLGTIKARGTYGATGTQYSPDGTRVLTWGDSGAFLWDRSSGTMIRAIAADSAILGAAFSPDGRRIATTDTNGRVWDAESGFLIWTLNSEGMAPCLWSPDAQFLLVGRRLYHAFTGAFVRTFAGATTGGAAAFNAIGNQLAMSGTSTNQVAIYSTAGGTVLATLTGHTGPVRAIRFSMNGSKILTTSDDLTAKLWNPATGLLTRSFANDLAAAEFNPAGSHLAVSPTINHTIQICVADATGTPFRTLTGHGALVRSIAFTPDNNSCVTAAIDGTARVWNIPVQATTKVLSGHVGQIGSAIWSPDYTQVMTTSDVSGDQTVRTWDPVNSTHLHMYAPHSNIVNAVAYSPDGTMVLTGSSDNQARLWDRSLATVIRTFSGHTNLVNAVAFSPDGTRIVTGSGDNSAKVWDVATGSVVQTVNASANVQTVGFSPDGTKILTGGADNNPKYWNVSDGSLIQTYSLAGSKAQLSPDGTKLAVIGSNPIQVHIRTIDTNTLVYTLSGQPYGVAAFAWSPDGNFIVTVPRNGPTSSYMELWQTSIGSRLTSVLVPEYGISGEP
jgi:eukaryotic-like serine/threonine-protein kinase